MYKEGRRYIYEGQVCYLERKPKHTPSTWSWHLLSRQGVGRRGSRAPDLLWRAQTLPSLDRSVTPVGTWDCLNTQDRNHQGVRLYTAPRHAALWTLSVTRVSADMEPRQCSQLTTKSLPRKASAMEPFGPLFAHWISTKHLLCPGTSSTG